MELVFCVKLVWEYGNGKRMKGLVVNREFFVREGRGWVKRGRGECLLVLIFVYYG